MVKAIALVGVSAGAHELLADPTGQDAAYDDSPTVASLGSRAFKIRAPFPGSLGMQSPAESSEPSSLLGCKFVRLLQAPLAHPLHRSQEFRALLGLHRRRARCLRASTRCCRHARLARTLARRPRRRRSCRRCCSRSRARRAPRLHAARSLGPCAGAGACGSGARRRPLRRHGHREDRVPRRSAATAAERERCAAAGGE